MLRLASALFATAALAVTASPAAAQTSNTKPSSGRNMQTQGMANIPVCTRRLGTIAIVEPDNQWWREYNLGSPEAILKIFVSRSVSPPVRWISRSASVDLPWSICAMMLKLRIFFSGLDNFQTFESGPWTAPSRGCWRARPGGRRFRSGRRTTATPRR